MSNTSEDFERLARGQVKVFDIHKKDLVINPLSLIFVTIGAYCFGLGLAIIRFVNLQIYLNGVHGTLFPFFPDILDFSGLVMIGAFLFLYGILLNLKK